MPHPSEIIATSGLRVGYGGRDVIHGLDLAIPDAAVTVMIGPNGSGKSTLLRALAGLAFPSGGGITLGGQPFSSFSRKALARRISFLPQAPLAPEGLTVIDLLRHGRYPHQGVFSRWTVADERACEEALDLTSMTELRNRALRTLSGGQRQRAWIAMSLAQQTGIMLLDEPTSFLDVAHQIEVLDLMRDLAHRKAKAVVAVLHDLNQAARHADHIIMIANGTIQASGSPGEVMRPETIDPVFGIESRIVVDPIEQTRIIVPMRPAHERQPRSR